MAEISGLHQLRNLSDEERDGVVQHLLVHCRDGKLAEGAICDVAQQFTISAKIFSQIWMRARECFASRRENADVSSRIRGRSCRKPSQRS